MSFAVTFSCFEFCGVFLKVLPLENIAVHYIKLFYNGGEQMHESRGFILKSIFVSFNITAKTNLGIAV